MSKQSKTVIHSRNVLALSGLTTCLWERLADSGVDEPTMALISDIQQKARAALEQAEELEGRETAARWSAINFRTDKDGPSAQ